MRSYNEKKTHRMIFMGVPVMKNTDYESSKKVIISEINTYIESHKDKRWFRVPENIFEIEEVFLRNVKGISDCSPLREFRNLRKLVFGTTDCSMTIKNLGGISSVQTVEFLSFMCRTKIKSGIEEISNMPSLKGLGLYNVVQEIPPDLITSLDRLEQISLSKQNYSSITQLPSNLKNVTIGVDSIKRLPDWKTAESVESVTIGGNTCHFENLSSFSCFPNIKSIKLRVPKLLTDISFVKNLHFLKSLEVNFAPIQDLTCLAHNDSIEEIRARKSHVTSLKNLGTLPKMKSLYLEKSKLQDINGIKSTFPNIETLWIWGTKIKDLSPLNGMTSIRELDVTMLKPKSWDFIRSLSNIETLDLCETSFSDLTLLMELPKLKNIRLAGSLVNTESDAYRNFQQIIENRQGKIK